MLVWSLAMLVQLLWTGVWSICSAPSRARAALAWEVRLRPLIITTSIAVRANRVNKPAAAQPAYSAYAVMECQFMIRWAICRDINPSRKKMEPSAGMALPWHCFGRLNPHRHTFCLLASERKQMIDICGGWMCVRMCICMCMFMCLHWMWQVKMLRNTSDWQGSKRIASFSAFTLLGSLNKTFLWFDSIHKCAEFESHVLQITSKFQDFQKWPKIRQLAEPWAAPLALPSPCQTFSGSEFCSWNNVWTLCGPDFAELALAFGMLLAWSCPPLWPNQFRFVKCQNQTKKILRNPTAAASSLAGGIDERIFDVSPVNSISKTESALCVSLKQTLYCESHFIQIDRGSWTLGLCTKEITCKPVNSNRSFHKTPLSHWVDKTVGLSRKRFDGDPAMANWKIKKQVVDCNFASSILFCTCWPRTRAANAAGKNPWFDAKLENQT